MTSSGSPCGACKFLRRKCVIGCVFAPYFCHEQGATHFAAIHKVFGASNVSKLLSKLKESDRSEAAVTISYEAQARLQDPVYGCVSQIFELQEKVVNLQEQLASLKELAAQCFPSGHSIANLNRVHGKCLPHQQANSWFQSPNSGTMLQFEPNITNNLGDMDPSSVENVAYPYVPGENISSGSSEMTFSTMDTLEIQKYDGQLVFQEEIDDLSVAFRYCQHS